MNWMLNSTIGAAAARPGAEVHNSLYRIAGLALLMAASAMAQSPLPTSKARLTVEAAHPGHPISPLLYGIFFEDINCSADGGLYAELVRNRNFQNSVHPEFWTLVKDSTADAAMAIDVSQPASPRNPRSLKVQVRQPGSSRVSVINDGFWGMSVERGRTYELSLLTRSEAGFRGPLTVTLEGRDGKVYASAEIAKLSSEWQTCRRSLRAKATDPAARLVVSTRQSGTFWLDMVSLFPGATWGRPPNRLRPDLARMLEALRPSFLRFPGGCWVEGETMSQAYRWKETIGNPAERRTQHNIWQYEATHGIGYHEYLQLCEDLHAEPLFVINCGMSHQENVPMSQLQPYLQDALDAIEYANGPADSPWGSRRARHGHRAPFHLKYMEIGNENGGPAYRERYARFCDTIHARYPQMHLVANEAGAGAGPGSLEIVDEHYYATPEFFIQNAGKYDDYDRQGPGIYVGEYAVTQGCGQGNLRAAVGEAAFMTGLERNSDVVRMASYAPLFANVNYKKWNPDLINFDSSRCYGLPSYYVQKLFSENRGEVVLPVTVEAAEVAPQMRAGAVGVGTWRTQAEFKNIEVRRGEEVLFKSDFVQGTQGWRLHGGDWSAHEGVLRQSSLAENVRAFAGDRAWTNYTLTLKARKLGGAEGFLIPFLVEDEEAKSWWNIGGWGNVRHAIEMEGALAKEVPGQIETGRWYDIRIEAASDRIRCFLDNVLVHEAHFPKTKPLYAVASRTRGGKELLLKVVNVSFTDLETELSFNGVRVRGPGTLTMLASAQGTDENSLEQPTRIAPITRSLTCGDAGFRCTFPANSVSVIRVPVRPGR